MIVLKSSTIVVVLRTSLQEPPAAAEIARGRLPQTRLMVRRVSLTWRLL
jgi:hypothetical protein